jgi:hypothetical protein
MSKTGMITRTAMLAAVNTVLLILGGMIRTNTLTFLVMASIVTAIAVIYINIRYSILLYITTSVIAFIFIPDKSIAVVYAMFFGNFGFIKAFAEKINNLYAQFFIKTSYFLITVYISYLIVGKSLIDLDALMQKYDLPLYIFVIMFILLFNIYDFIYSAVIRFIYKKFIDRGKNEKDRGNT